MCMFVCVCENVRFCARKQTLMCTLHIPEYQSNENWTKTMCISRYNYSNRIHCTSFIVRGRKAIRLTLCAFYISIKWIDPPIPSGKSISKIQLILTHWIAYWKGTEIHSKWTKTIVFSEAQSVTNFHRSIRN